MKSHGAPSIGGSYMATARKHWFRVMDSIGRDDLTNDELATMIRLMGALNTQWARDGLNGPDAASITLRSADLQALTGCLSLARARRTIVQLATKVTLTVDEQSTNTQIKWPKWLELQNLAAPTEGKPREALARELPPPQDARRKTQDARQKKERTPKKPSGLCPSELPEPQSSQAIKWAEARGTPLAELEFRWGRVCRWSEQKPTVKRTAAGWYSTLQNWVESGWGGEFSGSAPPPPGESPAHARQRRPHEAAREAQRRFMEANPEPDVPKLLALDGGVK